jgi:hypothetical protein
MIRQRKCSPSLPDEYTECPYVDEPSIQLTETSLMCAWDAIQAAATHVLNDDDNLGRSNEEVRNAFLSAPVPAVRTFDQVWSIFTGLNAWSARE